MATSSKAVPCSDTDYLRQDSAVRGQNYACVSFLSPIDAVHSRDAFCVSKFLQCFSRDAKQVIDSLLEHADNEAAHGVIERIRDRYPYVFCSDELQKEYDTFAAANSDRIQKEWSAENNGQACIYGLKIRGSYDTIQEAQNRAKDLKDSDPNFSVYVCEVGCWVPWSPNPDDIEDSRYSETQLNTLMKEYNTNVKMRDKVYRDRKNSKMCEGQAAGTSADTGFSDTIEEVDESGVMNELVKS